MLISSKDRVKKQQQKNHSVVVDNYMLCNHLAMEKVTYQCVFDVFASETM